MSALNGSFHLLKPMSVCGTSVYMESLMVFLHCPISNSPTRSCLSARNSGVPYGMKTLIMLFMTKQTDRNETFATQSSRKTIKCMNFHQMT